MRTSLLICGFTPFDGREINASWVAAGLVKQMAPKAFNTIDLSTLEIPVIWGEPEIQLRIALREKSPDIILALGEGREGWFDLETRAENIRRLRTDNRNETPTQKFIDPQGPPVFFGSFDTLSLQRQMKSDFPVRRSRSAGGYLCEETFYVLEKLRLESSALKHTLFVHLPPWNTPLLIDKVTRRCDESLLADFATQLVKNILRISEV